MQAIPKFTIKPGYRPQAEDTTIETDLLTFHLLRQRTPTERLRMAASLTRSARKLSLSSLKQHFGELSQKQFAQKIAFAWLQEHCPSDYIPTSDPQMWIQDSVSLAVKLHPILEELGISYYITGGVAAISYGEPRTTQDLDLVIEISPLDIQRLADVLISHEFYVSGVEDVKSGRMKTLQITDMETISRADLMVAETNEFEGQKFQRRRLIEFGGTLLYFASPEDLILNKLRWRQYSGSDKQWRDTLGILKVQGEKLDKGYLIKWAEQLGLVDSLNEAFIESGLERI
ncbi:MAG: hypothetical protein F6K41_35755 [Symploca sp. SIO3E6]|nr:hypothetical protein [Caldora sp. SIO3E6]